MCRRSVEVRRRMRRSQLLAALERPSAEGLCPFTPLYARSLRGTRRTALVSSRVCLSFGVSPILRAAAFCRAAVLYEVGHVVLRNVPYKRQTLHNNQRCSHGARQRACVERGEGAEPLAAKQRAKAAKNPASGACAEDPTELARASGRGGTRGGRCVRVPRWPVCGGARSPDRVAVRRVRTPGLGRLLSSAIPGRGLGGTARPSANRQRLEQSRLLPWSMRWRVPAR